MKIRAFKLVRGKVQIVSEIALLFRRNFIPRPMALDGSHALFFFDVVDWLVLIPWMMDDILLWQSV